MTEERIQLENLAEFEKASNELIEKVEEARRAKHSDKELNKLVKEGSLEAIEDFVEFQDLQTLLAEAKRLKCPKKNMNLKKLAELSAEFEPVAQEAAQIAQEGPKKSKAREHLLKIMKLGVR